MPLLDKSGLIAEEAVLRAADRRPVHLIGGFSTVFFNMGAHAAGREMILVRGARNWDEHERLARSLGCEVVVIRMNPV